ncbi:MAG: hypothetical protein ACSI46_14160 [Gloeotrichia echinulata DVL01]|jgi:hypothetical protein
MRKHSKLLLAENTKMRKQLKLLRKQLKLLLAENTKMRKQLKLLRKHFSILTKTKAAFHLVFVKVVKGQGSQILGLQYHNLPWKRPFPVTCMILASLGRWK